MYKYITYLFSVLFLSYSVQAQKDQPILNNIHERVPEMQHSFPKEFKINPTRTEVPLPLPPPTIHTNPVAPPAPGDDDRAAFFVPGFGGDQSKWSRAAEASENGDNSSFKARKIQAVVYDYAENTTLFWAASNLSDAMKNNAQVLQQTAEERKKNFLIGHSQGGVVSRYLVAQDYCSNNPQAKDYYGGIVTVNSSLRGAQIINNREQGMFHQLGNRICNVFEAVVLAEIPNILLKLANLDAQGNIGDGEKDLCDIVLNANPNVPSALNLAFNSLTEEISLQYQVGAYHLGFMNDCDAPDIAKVAFYGVEPYAPVEGAMFDNPIFYRTIQHFFGDVNQGGFWEANDDSKLAKEADEKAQDAFSTYIEQRDKADDIYEAMVNFPPLWVTHSAAWNKAKKKRDASYDLFRLYHDLNDEWMVIIGAMAPEDFNPQAAAHHCTCNINQGTYISTETIDNVYAEEDCTHANAVNCNYSYIPSNVITFDIKPSDGVVLAESAMYMTGTDAIVRESVPADDDGENTGSSHMQARNDKNLKNMLFELYEGNIHDFFETPKRQ